MPRKTSAARESERPARAPRREPIIKRDCQLCADQLELDYKQTELLRKFVTERGKILPRRATGVCTRHQRHLSRAIKNARVVALLPYVRH